MRHSFCLMSVTLCLTLASCSKKEPQPAQENNTDAAQSGVVDSQDGQQLDSQIVESAHHDHQQGDHGDSKGHGDHHASVDKHAGHQAHAKDTQHAKHGHQTKHGHQPKKGHAHEKSNDAGTQSRALADNSAELDRLIASAKDTHESADDPATIFAKRILPIMQSKKSSSCTECHFSGVELSDYIDKDQAKTFASLKNGGLIDVENPDKSKLLRFIARRPSQSNALLDKVRANELVAFRSWIRAAVKDPQLLQAKSTISLGTQVPKEVIQHARKDRVLASFLDNIWSEVGRCVNCHSPERNRKKIGRNGFTKEDVDAISWIVPNDPAATLKQLVDSGNIDIDDPSASFVLTKPSGLEEHGGGPKFFPGSPTYRNFLTFLNDYSAVIKSKYKSKDDLPAPSEEITLLSKQQLRIANVPRQFGGMALQVNIFRRDQRTGKWSERRWATGFSRVNAKRNVWQNPIMVTAASGSPLEKEVRARKSLPAGSYLIKIYIDRSRKTEKDPTHKLGERDYVAEVEVNGAWKPGYQPPKIVDFPKARD